MPIHTPLRGLRCFCVAADCLSFKDTAQQLCLTPSAVSHQIKQLEQQLGISLFERQTRAIRLTSEGHRFYQAILPLMRGLADTIGEFSRHAPEQVVSITLPEFFASEFFLPRLIGWTTQYPAINLRIETVKTRQDHSHYSDVQILLSHTKPTDKPSHLLFPISYVPAGNQHWFQRMQLQDNPLAALEDAVLIVHQARPWAWHQWADQAGFEDFRPKQIIQLDSMFSVARAAQQGLGIALIPLPISQNWFDNASLYRLSTIELTTRDHYYLVQHESTTSRTEVQLLVDWVLEKFRTHR